VLQQQARFDSFVAEYNSRVASPSIPSWNQIAGFLESMRRLRDSTGFAA
jgi:hypothetical protein